MIRSPSRLDGFTLIELLAGIVILAIVGGVAIQISSDLRMEAWVARVRGISSAFAAGVQQARTACRAFGNPSTATVNLAQFPPGTVDFDVGCIPLGTNWASGVPTRDNCTELFNTLVQGVVTSNVANGATPLVTESGTATYCGYMSMDPYGNYPSGLSSPLRVIFFHTGAMRGRVDRREYSNSAVVLLPQD